MSPKTTPSNERTSTSTSTSTPLPTVREESNYVEGRRTGTGQQAQSQQSQQSQEENKEEIQMQLRKGGGSVSSHNRRSSTLNEVLTSLTWKDKFFEKDRSVIGVFDFDKKALKLDSWNYYWFPSLVISMIFLVPLFSILKIWYWLRVIIVLAVAGLYLLFLKRRIDKNLMIPHIALTREYIIYVQCPNANSNGKGKSGGGGDGTFGGQDQNQDGGLEDEDSSVEEDPEWVFPAARHPNEERIPYQSIVSISFESLGTCCCCSLFCCCLKPRGSYGLTAVTIDTKDADATEDETEQNHIVTTDGLSTTSGNGVGGFFFFRSSNKTRTTSATTTTTTTTTHNNRASRRSSTTGVGRPSDYRSSFKPKHSQLGGEMHDYEIKGLEDPKVFVKVVRAMMDRVQKLELRKKQKEAAAAQQAQAKILEQQERQQKSVQQAAEAPIAAPTTRIANEDEDDRPEHQQQQQQKSSSPQQQQQQQQQQQSSSHPQLSQAVPTSPVDVGSTEPQQEQDSKQEQNNDNSQ